jgi:lipoprotein-anchoring transpeptidase ErfK/SrfK
MGWMSDQRVLRPRYGRIVAFAVAASTTLVAVVGALVLDSSGPGGAARGGSAISLTAADTTVGAGSAGSGDGARSEQAGAAASAALATAPSTGLRASLAVGVPPAGTSTVPSTDPATGSATTSPTSDDTALPASSGTGRRVVFSESRQRVWLVSGDEVERTYPVSGSIYDNLDPGTYRVYSRSERATGVDGSELRYMVRFAHGDHAAIGFHWIPRLHGERMQTRAQLGTARSHGCIRQATPDAQALWRFAPVGTTVVVTA